MNFRFVAGALAALLVCGTASRAQDPSGTTVLVGSDHRKTQNLNGDWHIIVDKKPGHSEDDCRFKQKLLSQLQPPSQAAQAHVSSAPSTPALHARAPSSELLSSLTDPSC